MISSYFRPAHAAPATHLLFLVPGAGESSGCAPPVAYQARVMNTSDIPMPSMLSPGQVHYLSTARPIYYSPRAHLVDWLPDHLLALAVPVVAYWISSILFHILDVSEWKWLDKYRLHESAEVKTRNLVTRAQVIRAVILQQIVQTIIGYFWMEKKLSGELVDHLGNMQQLEPTVASILSWTLGDKTGARILDRDGALLLYAVYWWAIPSAKFFFGMYVAIEPYSFRLSLTLISCRAGSLSTHGSTSSTARCTRTAGSTSSSTPCITGCTSLMHLARSTTTRSRDLCSTLLAQASRSSWRT